jgi:HK97 family phage prohead protease
MDIEYKALPTFTKSIEGRTVTGIAAVFGNIDSYNDILYPGAFKKTIKENGKRVRHLWQHDTQNPPIAAVKELREVGVDELPKEVVKEFPDAKGGLLVVRDYLETPRGQEVLEGIRTNAINEMSFGFNTVKVDFDEVEQGDVKLQVRNLREVRLWDTSDVNWGANPATSAAKSALDFKLSQLYNLAGEIIEDFSGVEHVYDHLLTKLGRVDKEALSAELADLLDILRAEPPLPALTPFLKLRLERQRIEHGEKL